MDRVCATTHQAAADQLRSTYKALVYFCARQPDHRDVRAMKKRDILRPEYQPLIALRRQPAKDMLITLEGALQ